MSYRTWFKNHGEKHKKIVSRLQSKGFSKDQIIDYFEFDNMLIEEPGFCPLYKESKKCHNVAQLNCYLCACPLFRFGETGLSESDGVRTYSYCHVNSKYGCQRQYGEAIHQDCSACTVPHSRKYVDVNYNTNWFKVMGQCDIESGDV